VPTGRKKTGTNRPRCDRLLPLDFSIPDSILIEKCEDDLGDYLGDVGRGRSGKDRNPSHHRTESVLPVLFVGGETSGINGEASLHGGFHRLVNLGTNSAPDVVERATVNSTNRLGRLIGESTGGLGPGILV
jgi:hypothetical protein